jgi:hypothetical protein
MVESNKKEKIMTFKTAAEREQALEIAQRYHHYRETYPGLGDVRILNRLHSEGINIDINGMLEAVQFALDSDGGIPESQTEMNTREAAAYLGVREDTFRGWVLPSYSKRAALADDFTPLPANAPLPLRLNPNERGKPARFSAESIRALKEWMEENEFDRRSSMRKK